MLINPFKPFRIKIIDIFLFFNMKREFAENVIKSSVDSLGSKREKIDAGDGVTLEKNVEYTLSENAKKNYYDNFRYNDFRIDVGDYVKKIKSPYFYSPDQYSLLRRPDKSLTFTLFKDEFRVPNALAFALALAEKKSFDAKLNLEKCNTAFVTIEQEVETLTRICELDRNSKIKIDKLLDAQMKKKKAGEELERASSIYQKFEHPTISIDDVCFWLFGFWEIAIEAMPKQDVFKLLKKTVHKLWTYQEFSPLHFLCNCTTDPDCGWRMKLGDDKPSRKLQRKRKRECKPLWMWLEKNVHDPDFTGDDDLLSKQLISPTASPIATSIVSSDSSTNIKLI